MYHDDLHHDDVYHDGDYLCLNFDIYESFCLQSSHSTMLEYYRSLRES